MGIFVGFLGGVGFFLWVFEFYGNWLLGGSVKLFSFCFCLLGFWVLVFGFGWPPFLSLTHVTRD